MKQIAFLPIPGNANEIAILDAMNEYRQTLVDPRLFDAFFAEGFGHQKEYRGFSVKIDEALVRDVAPVVIEVPDGGTITFGFANSLVTAVYTNPNLPVQEPIPSTIYSRAENEGKPSCH